MDHGLFFVERRNIVGLSQAKIGELLGYSYQSVSAWESGRSFPDLSIWSKYASILQVDLRGFLLCKDSKENNRCDTLVFDIDRFSSNLKYLRKKNNLTQLDLAKLINVNVKTIASYEKGTSFPSLGKFASLCNLYKISLDELYFVIQESNSNGSDSKPIKKKRIFLPIILPIIIATGVTGTAVTTSVVYRNRMAQNNVTIIPNNTDINDNLPSDNPSGQNNENNSQDNPNDNTGTDTNPVDDNPNSGGGDDTPVNPGTDEQTPIDDNPNDSGNDDPVETPVSNKGILKFDYITDENNDHIYDINHAEPLSIVINNLSDNQVDTISIYVDEQHYDLDKTSFTQSEEMVTIDKSFLEGIYTTSGYNSFIMLDYIAVQKDSNTEYLMGHNNYFQLGIVDSTAAIKVSSYDDFIFGQDQYRYYILQNDITVPTSLMNKDLKGVVDGRGFSLGNVTTSEIGSESSLYDYGVFRYFSGVIYDLKVKDVNITTNKNALENTHVAGLMATGLEYVVSKCSFDNINIRVYANYTDTYVSLVSAVGVKCEMDRLSITNSKIEVTGNKSVSIAGVVARSSTELNYSIRDVLISSCVFKNNSQDSEVTTVGVASYHIRSIKRAVIYGCTFESVSTVNAYPRFGGILIEYCNEIDGCLFLKNNVNIVNPANNRLFLVYGSTVNDCYYTSDNTCNFEINDNDVGNGKAVEIDKIKTTDFYNQRGYRSSNWNLSNLSSGSDYLVPTLK